MMEKKIEKGVKKGVKSPRKVWNRLFGGILNRKPV